MGQSTAAGDTPAEASDKMPPVTALFDLKRSASEDVIYFRNKDVLRGRVLNETVTIATQYGMLKVPMRRCAGLSFEGARENTEAVVTVNFNRITGIVTDRVINFESKSSETKIPIRKEKIRFLLLQKTANEADFIEKSPKADLFLMANGDLLSGEAVERKVTIRTSHAKVPVSFAEMKDVTMQGADNVTAVIIKVNGDTMRGTLETDEITLDLQVGIQVEAIDKDKFARVFVDQAQKQAPAEFEAQQPIAGESDGTGPCPARAEQKTMALDLGDGIKMQLVLIPAGKFVMGAPGSETGRDYDEGPQRRVAISSSFYIGVTEVTQDQYAAIMGENPSKFSGLSNPVEQVSWEDAVAFCKALSKKTGQTVRLPTEAQWEYACRAGSKTRFSFGDDDRDLGAHAWYKDNSDWKTHPVGKKKANAWGLYDMHGNVTEWCSDRYAESYALLTTEDPQGPDGGKYRVHRGGEWLSNPAHCRAADRYRSTPDFQSVATGFRVAVDLR
jgi:formylglycine-generating enzyme required for sulfatase activity